MYCAVAAGATLAEAAAFGNLVASITIQQLGTTGFATPEQVRGAGANRAGPDWLSPDFSFKESLPCIE